MYNNTVGQSNSSDTRPYIYSTTATTGNAFLTMLFIFGGRQQCGAMLSSFIILLKHYTQFSCVHIHCLVCRNVQQMNVSGNIIIFFIKILWYISTLYTLSCQMVFCLTTICNKAKQMVYLWKDLTSTAMPTTSDWCHGPA